jgi:peptide/nickel transport system permease protein
MGRYLAGRLVTCVVAVFAVTFLVFAAFSAIPQSTRTRRGPFQPSQGSLVHRYGDYVWGLVRHGDLGSSTANREPVESRLRRAVPVTLSLVLGGLVVWLLVAVPLGVLAALRPRSLLDRVVVIGVLVGVAVHPLWLGLTSGWLFGERLSVLPAAGYCDLFSPSTGCGGPVGWTTHMLMPWLVFGICTAALSTLLVRALVLEELHKDYVQVARAKGAAEVHVVRRHVLRNVGAPVVAVAGLNTAVALGGVVFVETAFGLPGLGGMFRRAAMQHDVPTAAGIVLFATVAIMLVNLIVDLACAALDPRVRLAGSASAR